MKVFFRDSGYQSFYEKNGYVKIQILNDDDINFLLETCRSLPPPFINLGFHTSLLNQRKESRLKAHEAVKSVLWKRTEPIFNDFRPMLGSFLVKQGGELGICQIHQDWTFVDESDGSRSFHVWCPLVKTDSENGNLCVLPGSHLLPTMPRVAPSSYFPYQSERCIEFIQKHSIAVPTQAGEAIIYDNALIHHSPPNKTNLPRIAAGLLTIPKSERLVHLNGTNSSFEYEKYFVEEDFYLNYSEVNHPGNGSEAEKMVFENNRDSLETLEKYC